MDRFRDYDFVELKGETLGIPVKRGTCGFIVLTLPGDDSYLVEFVDDAGKTLAITTVSASSLRFIEHAHSAPEPVYEKVGY